MAYDEALAARVRGLLAERSEVREQRMFGGLTFMVRGHMCCGVHGDELIVRLDSADEADAFARPHTRPMDFTGPPLPGFVTVGSAGVLGDSLERWVCEAVRRAESLPPK